MKTANRLSISTVAFLIGLGTMPVLAQTANDDAVNANLSGNVSGNNMSGNISRRDNLSGTASTALEQTLVNGDVAAENSIEQGLKSGQLTPAEAARLERGQARIDQSESTALDNGRLSNGEVNRIDRAQTAEDNRITALDNNSMTVTPGTASNRLAADVQRDANQEKRIDQGIANGSLTASEAGKLEQGQARLDNVEARDGRNGNLTVSGQQQIRSDENAQSTDIRADRHNDAMTVSDNDRNSGRDRMDHHWADRNDHRMGSNDNDRYRDGSDRHDDMTVATSGNSSNVLVSGSNTQAGASVGSTAAVSPPITPHPAPHVAPPVVVAHHK